MTYISTPFDFKWYVLFAPEYLFDKNANCYNSKRGRLIKRTEISRCYGYYIRGKFYSRSHLRQYLVKIEKIDCPF